MAKRVTDGSPRPSSTGDWGHLAITATPGHQLPADCGEEQAIRCPREVDLGGSGRRAHQRPGLTRHWVDLADDQGRGLTLGCRVAKHEADASTWNPLQRPANPRGRDLGAAGLEVRYLERRWLTLLPEHEQDERGRTTPGVISDGLDIPKHQFRLRPIESKSPQDAASRRPRHESRKCDCHLASPSGSTPPRECWSPD